MDKIKIDFNHPYGEYLYMCGVPKEKHQEFYEKFGYYCHSISTPAEEKARAFAWMLRAAGNTKTEHPAASHAQDIKVKDGP